jgi:hypothetical protein
MVNPFFVTNLFLNYAIRTIPQLEIKVSAYHRSQSRLTDY